MRQLLHRQLKILVRIYCQNLSPEFLAEIYCRPKNSLQRFVIGTIRFKPRRGSPLFPCQKKPATPRSRRPMSRRIIYQAFATGLRGGWRQMSKERKIKVANPAG